jgi:hypothetical protein
MTVRYAVDQNGLSRKTVGYGTVWTRSADKFGAPIKKFNFKINNIQF